MTGGGGLDREIHREADEDLLHAHFLEPEGDVIILGQRRGVERFAAGRQPQRDHRPAAEAGGDAGAGHGLGEALADQQVLGMPFGEFVHVAACDPGGGRAFQRIDRQLDEVLPLDEEVEELQLQRMDDVLGIMHRDAEESDADRALVRPDAADQRVQAIGLVGRPGMRNVDAMDVGKFRRDRVDLADRVRIVGIDADEEMIIGVAQEAEIGAQHGADDIGLLPGGDHDGEGDLGLAEQFLRRHLGVAGAHDGAAIEATNPVIGIDEGVVDARHQNDQTHRDGQNFERGLIGYDECVPVQTREHGKTLLTQFAYRFSASAKSLAFYALTPC